MLNPGSATERSDKSLIKAAQRGDLQAYELIVYRYQNKVYKLACRICRNSEDAKDVTQNVFVRLNQSLTKFNTDKQFFTWLYRIVVNISYDFLRKENKFRACSLEEVPENSEGLIYNEKSGSEELFDKIYDLLSLLSTNHETFNYRCTIILIFKQLQCVRSIKQNFTR